MSDHEYSQGICGDGVAILKDGQPMTIEEIVDELQKGQAARTQSGQGAEADEVYLPFGAASAYADAKEGDKDNMTISCELVVELIDEIYRLNAHPQPAQHGSVPEGWKLVPVEPTESMLRDAADNLCGEFGVEFVRPKEKFARSVYRELVGFAPQPPKDKTQEAGDE